MTFFLYGQSQTGGVYNVKNYGAIGDGSNDDTTAINAAVTASSGNGIIFFPKGTYKVTSAILIPAGSLIFIGEGNASTIFGSFNGFIFDNLSTPYSPGSGPSAIEQLNISNGYSGNTFPVTANGTWSASGSPVNITLSGSNPGVAAGGALWMKDANISTNTVFVGMITSVASWPTVTVSSAAIGSGAHSSLSLQVIQCYAASGTWLANATTIPMGAAAPAGISGQYYLFDYEDFLADPKTDFNIGVVTWIGNNLVFTAGTGAVAPSQGSSDRLWLAPVAGAIRYSSVTGAVVSNCAISGFIGLTSSEDKIVPNDPTLGGAEGFHIRMDTCTIANPSGCQAVPGQTGVYLQNNSLITNMTGSGHWCAIRLSGTACSVIGGQFEVNYFGIIVGGDFTASNNSGSGIVLSTFSMESNLLGIYVKSGGDMNINAVGIICNAVNPIGGIYIGMNGVIQNSALQGNFGTGYAVYIGDPGNNRGALKLISVSAVNQSNTALSWRIPAQAWWGTCEQCDNPPLIYTYANLPGVLANPVTAVEGNEFNISDGTNGLTWGQTVTNTGTHTTHYKVRYNGTNWTVVGA